jgi:RecB family exonuclease
MIDSKIGTGFHTIAEEALRNSDIKCDVERQLSADIEGYRVGGTCDLILYDDNDVATVADWKTMKAYPAKKAFNGEEHEKFIKQLSLYAYMLRKQGTQVNDTGYIYVVVVGWTARDRDLPRIFRIDLKLMTDEEVEAYVKERIEAVGTVKEADCPQWMCEKYCELRDVCPHYNNHELGDES